MGFLDKLLGRGKKAVGDMMGDSSMRREGGAQEPAADAADPAAQHEQVAPEQHDQAAEPKADQENA